jgi:hypothetical protein
MDPQLKAAISALFDIQQRVTRLESILAGVLGQSREHIEQINALMARNQALTQRLIDAERRRDAIYQMVGRMRLAPRTPEDLVADKGEWRRDLERAFAEVGGHR